MGIRNNKDLKNVDLYLHIPFCRSKCSYCLFPSMPLKGKAQAEGYIDYLTEEMHFYSNVFRNIEFVIFISEEVPQYTLFCANEQVVKEYVRLFCFP